MNIARTFTALIVPFVALYGYPMSDGDIPVDVCSSLRLPGNCKPAQLSAEDNMREGVIKGNKMRFKRTLELPEQTPKMNPDACEAHFSISYTQMNDQIRVVTEVINEKCIVSSGDYALRIRTASESGHVQTRTFAESWQRSDDEPIKLTNYYPMENDSDLIWVKVKSNRRTACACNL